MKNIIATTDASVFSANFGKLEWSFRVFQDISLFPLLMSCTEGESVPLSTSQCHSEHRGFHPSEGMFVSVCLFLCSSTVVTEPLLPKRLWARKPLNLSQSLVRERYRNERWRDREDAWAATHFTLKWEMTEWGKERKKERWAQIVLPRKEKWKQIDLCG